MYFFLELDEDDDDNNRSIDHSVEDCEDEDEINLRIPSKKKNFQNECCSEQKEKCLDDESKRFLKNPKELSSDKLKIISIDKKIKFESKYIILYN